jgi:geranylgeranyl pyrophosphate synthase
MTFKEKNFTYKVLRSKKTKNNDIVKVFSLIKKYNGLNNAKLISNKFSEDAKKLLLTFPQNKFRNIIMSLIDYLNQRKK